MILNNQETNDADGLMNRIMPKAFEPKSKETNLKPKLEIMSNEEKKISF